MAASIQRRQSVRRQLTELAQWLEAGDGEPLAVFGSSDRDEWLLRLSGMALTLTDQHKLDKSGRCRFCCTPPAGWRRWWPRWSRPTPCRVQQTAQLFSRATVDVVWWQVFQLLGDKRPIQEVRNWLAAEATTATLPRVEDEGTSCTGEEFALLTDGRVLMRDEQTEEPPEYGRHSVEANAEAVNVSALVARAVASGEAVALAWPATDPDDDGWVVWSGQEWPTGVLPLACAQTRS